MSEKIPYTEIIERMKSDIEETAYNDGYAKGLKDGQHKSDTEEYHVGMKDAWDIVRKIFDMTDYQRYAIFGGENSRYIMMNLPIGQVVEKLKTYEEIKAGDEVIYNNTHPRVRHRTEEDMKTVTEKQWKIVR